MSYINLFQTLLYCKILFYICRGNFYSIHTVSEIDKKILMSFIATEIECIHRCNTMSNCIQSGMVTKTGGYKECLLLANEKDVLISAGEDSKFTLFVETGEPTVRDGRSTTRLGLSCKQIKDDFPESESGYYWLSLNGAVEVYCEMDTADGGWLEIGRVNYTTGANPEKYGIYGESMSSDIKSLKNVQNGNFLLDGDGLVELNKIFKIKQIRIYCQKNGRNILDMMIKDNDVGKGIIRFILMTKNTCPITYGVYQILPDDTNSTISVNNQHLGHGGGGNFGNACSSSTRLLEPKYRLYDEFLNFNGTHYVQLMYYNGTARFECDDYYNDAEYSPIGLWRLFIR